MKKNHILLILAFLTSATIIGFYIYALYHSKENKLDLEALSTIITFVLVAIFSIIIIFKENKAILAIYLVISISTLNIFGIIYAALGISKISKIERIERLEKQNNEPKKGMKEFNIYKDIKIKDDYKWTFITSIIILSIYLIIYLGGVNYYFLKKLYEFTGPIKSLSDLSGAIAGLIFYAIPTIIYLTFYMIALIPVPIMIFTLKLNADAIKKDPHSYYILRFLGFLTLTFVNAIASIKIIKEIKAQDNVLF